MNKQLRPLFLQNLKFSVPALNVIGLRLNQFMPEAIMTEHSHNHTQFLVFLLGKARHRVGEKWYDCRPGSVICVDATKKHLYEKQPGKSPLVLVMDVEMDSSRGSALEFSQLSAADLTKVRHVVGELMALRTPDQREMLMQLGSLLFAILDKLLRASGWLKPVNRFSDSRNLATAKFIERLLDRMDAKTELDDIAQRAGYELPVLNRKLRQECGLTLGQLRTRLRLRRAQDLLVQGWAISKVAALTGMDDKNYFTRWFRLHTGMAPTQWKRNPRMVERM